MLFLNTALLLGALGISIPIIIHLLNRRSSRVVSWGAMNFLLESLAIRNRRIQLEEALLMATRCLLVGLLAIALARPFVPPGSSIPWLLVLPLFLISVIGLGVAVVLHNEPIWRRRIGIASILLLLTCIALVVFEKALNLSRFAPGARQDIALIIDASTSMTIESAGQSNFDRAIEEARSLIKRAPRGHAFSLILGGPSPTGLVLDPTTDRAALDLALASAAPLDGAMGTYQALTMASLSLARGNHPAKQILLLSDGQSVGWEIGQTGRWNFLREAFRNLPTEPQIMLRRLALPARVRNAAVVDIDIAREVVGVDRPVEIVVTVENLGDESITPGALLLTCDDGREFRDQSLGQLRPGEQQAVRFTHQFSQAGSQALQVVLEVEDDLAGDNTAAYALNVAEVLKVLIVDGRPTGGALERASTFAAVALAPSSLTIDPNLEANIPGTSDEGSDDFNINADPTLDPIRFLVEPRVVSASAVASIPDFKDYDSVILADVPRLDAGSAEALANYVERGGGLLVAVGDKVQADFYNTWVGKEDRPLLPANLATAPTFATAESPLTPSTRTLTHPALQKIADASKSDFSAASITHFRAQIIPDTLTKETSIGARLNNGETLLSSRPFGKGQVVLLGVPLDLTGGNLVTRQAFLPFLHELVYHLADPAAYQLNLEPGWEVNLALTGKRGKAIGRGLLGNYYNSHGDKEPTYIRQDDAIQFNWLNGSPAPGINADGFRVEWTGKLQVPRQGRYQFVADVDDSFEMFLDGKSLGELTNPGGRRRMNERLEANSWHDFRAVYRENSGEAKVMLSWETDGLPLQPIPGEAFRTFGSDTPVGRESTLSTYEVEGPGGRPRTASLSAAGEGAVLKLQGEIASGLYRLAVPAEQASYFADFLQPGQVQIPFTVKRDPAEGRLTALTKADLDFIASFVTLAQPQTLEELIGFLQGNQFGQELWKYLALGALVFLLVEILLSRWISHSRRLGEDIKITFESKEAPTSKFHEQLARLGKG